VTKKDYVKFAEMFKRQYRDLLPQQDRQFLLSVINESCYIFKADNPNFNKQKFLDACGVK
jgi:hypothetical protein